MAGSSNSGQQSMTEPHQPTPPLEERFARLGTVRRGHWAWPDDVPFPWRDAECAAALRGHAVRWPLTVEEFRLLPGRWELI
ncbi:MAG: hypothetical protein ACLFTL_12185, partial [Alphaproteobacteria bacterium]